MNRTCDIQTLKSNETVPSGVGCLYCESRETQNRKVPLFSPDQLPIPKDSSQKHSQVTMNIIGHPAIDLFKSQT